MASALISFGALARRRGDASRARALYEEALAIQQDLGDRNYLCFALEGGDVAAQAALQEMLAPLLAMGYLHRVSQMLESLACLAAACGQAELAIRLAGAAEAVGEVYGREWHTPWRMEAGRWLAPVRSALGEAAADATWTADVRYPIPRH